MLFNCDYIPGFPVFLLQIYKIGELVFYDVLKTSFMIN